jgi:hypothetical protein
MFIFNKEKQGFIDRIAALEVRVEQLARSLNALHDVKTMQSDNKLKSAKLEAERLRRNEYQRNYYRLKKAKQS